MGILDRFRKQKPAQAEEKALDPSGGGVLAGPIPVNVAAIGAYGAGNFSGAYLNNADLYSVCSFLNQKMASLPWYVYKIKDGQRAKVALARYRMATKQALTEAALQRALIERKAAIEETEILDDKSGLGKLIAHPNKHQGQDQFMESVCGYHNLSGEANVYLNSGLDPEGEVVEMEVLPTQFVEDYYDPKDLYGILGHKLNVGGSINIAKENLLRWKNWRPDFDAATRIHMRGISIVQVGWNTYLMNDGGGKAVATMLKNGGSKGALTPAPVGNQIIKLDKTQLDMAKRDVNQAYNGVDNLGTIGVLAGPYDYLNFGLSAIDMAIIPVMQLTLHQWCRILRLPTVLFDAEHTSDNNYQNALRDLVTNTVVPKLSSYRDQLNQKLLPRFKAEGKYFIDFDISALPELQKDMEKLVNSLSRAYWLTEDEKRLAMNYEAKGGVYDTSLVAQGLVPIDMAGENLAQPEPNPADDPGVDY